MTNPEDEFPDSRISIAFYGSTNSFPTSNAKKSKLDFSLDPLSDYSDLPEKETSVSERHTGPFSTLGSKLDLKHEEDVSSCSSTASSPPATPMVQEQHTFRIAIPTGSTQSPSVSMNSSTISSEKSGLSSARFSLSSPSLLPLLRPSFKRPSENKESPEKSVSSASKVLAVSFVEAARTGNLEKLQEILQLHPELNINSRVCEYTALHFAAFYGLTKMVKWLIDNGADTEQKNSSGDTPLLLACSKGFPRCVLNLIKAGADASAINKRGQNSLFRAIHSGDLLTIKTLVEIGKVDLNWKNDQNSTGLHEAAYLGFADITEYLISKGAALDALNLQQRTPLHRACISGKTQIVQLLIESGADMDAQDMEGRSALHLAAFYSRPEIAALLINNLANNKLVDQFNKTPKEVAVSRGNKNLAKILK